MFPALMNEKQWRIQGGPAPLPSRFFQNHTVFRQFFGKTPHFEKISEPPLPWGKNSAGPPLGSKLDCPPWGQKSAGPPWPKSWIRPWKAETPAAEEESIWYGLPLPSTFTNHKAETTWILRIPNLINFNHKDQDKIATWQVNTLWHLSLQSAYLWSDQDYESETNPWSMILWWISCC